MKKLILLCITVLFHLNFYAQMAITSSAFDKSAQKVPGYNPDQLSVGNSYIVKKIEIDAQIKNQLAEVRVTQTIFNPGKRDLEVELFFPLPNDGVVQNFMMMVNGEEVHGELLKK